jgi:hypothetical protein
MFSSFSLFRIMTSLIPSLMVLRAWFVFTSFYTRSTLCATAYYSAFVTPGQIILHHHHRRQVVTATTATCFETPQHRSPSTISRCCTTTTASSSRSSSSSSNTDSTNDVSSSSSSSSSSSWRLSIRNASYTLSSTKIVQEHEATGLPLRKRRRRLLPWMADRIRLVPAWLTRKGIRRTHTEQRSITHIERNETATTIASSLDFDYEYEQLLLGDGWNAVTNATAATTGILLIHPIGVGIGKWYYHRLLQALSSKQHDVYEDETENGSRPMSRRRPVLVVVPDLLGSSSACPPTISTSCNSNDDDDNNNNNKMVQNKAWTRPLPLLNISDWANQTVQLMQQIQNDLPTLQNWCLVANGGCAPIALQVAQQAILLAEQQQQPSSPSSTTTNTAACTTSILNVTNIVLSSVPRRALFLESSDPVKVIKSYRTLCGLIGKLFW